MNRMLRIVLALCLISTCARAQSDQHYTMFMYNKLLYNPGYAGSRDATSINAVYRNQWTGIDGSPKTLNLSADGPVGSYMKPFRKVAVGASISNEKTGVENNTAFRTYYAYRIRLEQSVLSFGLSAGGSLYSAAYSKLIILDPSDPNFSADINNAFLPNFGSGVYWSGERFYCGLSVPNMIQNYYDKKQAVLAARQIRAFYLSGGYTFDVNENIRLQPQALLRYAKNAKYRLPYSADINLSAIAYERFLAGITYRTDKSLEVVAHVQATKNLNIGYAFDYMLSGLNGYSGGTHEIVVGYDIVKDNSKFLTPRFIKKF